jgi:hypothetical protein
MANESYLNEPMSESLDAHVRYGASLSRRSCNPKERTLCMTQCCLLIPDPALRVTGDVTKERWAVTHRCAKFVFEILRYEPCEGILHNTSVMTLWEPLQALCQAVSGQKLYLEKAWTSIPNLVANSCSQLVG